MGLYQSEGRNYLAAEVRDNWQYAIDKSKGYHLTNNQQLKTQLSP
jgi:hypothetical protein